MKTLFQLKKIYMKTKKNALMKKRYEILIENNVTILH